MSDRSSLVASDGTSPLIGDYEVEDVARCLLNLLVLNTQNVQCYLLSTLTACVSPSKRLPGVLFSKIREAIL